MKIARSLLNALAPGLILALLVFLGTAPRTVAQNATGSANANPNATIPAAQDLTLVGSDKVVGGTTTSGSHAAVSGIFTEFTLPKGTVPQLVTSAADGTIYYAMGGSNKIGRITSSSANSLSVRHFTIPTANSFPVGMVAAADGTLWFAEQNGSQIGRLDAKTGAITEFKTPTPNSGPVGITVGPDGGIWFTEAFSNKIGRLDPDKPDSIEEFSIPTPVSAPLYITNGGDGGLWYVGVRGHQLGRIDVSTRSFVEYPTPTSKAGPTSVILGGDGALWISELNADKIARFDITARKFTDEVPVNSQKNGPRSGPGILVNGPDGNIWFTEMFGNQISRMNPWTRQIFEFGVPSRPTLTTAVEGAADTAAAALLEAQAALGPGKTLGPTAGPGGLAFSSDGTLWYTAIFGQLVSRFRLK